jgi:hypothetical protein
MRPRVADVVNGQRAHDQVEGTIRVGQRLSESGLVDLHPARRVRFGQVHHDRAGIKGGDIGFLLQQFPQIQAGAAGCVQDLPAGYGP